MQREALAASRRDLTPLFLLWLIVTAYNLFKPYHIDDAAYLQIAQWISAHPLHPMSGLLNWQGLDEPIYRTNQPPLYFYFLAVWSKLFGFSEPAMHSFQSLAALACIFLFYKLARTFAGDIAIWLTAVLVLGPAFIVEQNLMVDVPLLATWLAFFNLLVCEVRNSRQTRRYLLAALACSAALLIKYSSLVLLPILLLSLLIERRKKQSWLALIPLLVLVGWSLFNIFDYGGVHILTRPPQEGHDSFLPIKLLGAWVVALGAVTPLGLIVIVQSAVIPVKWRNVIYAAAAFGFIALVVTFVKKPSLDHFLNRVLWFAFVVNGAALLACIVPPTLDLVRRKLWNPEVGREAAPTAYLVLWIVGTTVFYVLLAPFMAARHVLLILPPLLLLAGLKWRGSLKGGSLKGGSLAPSSRIFGLALTVVVSAALCVSDWRFARFFRSEATLVMRSLPKTGTVWTNGHWGWQWYAMQQGMREIDVERSVMKPGDVFVRASVDSKVPKSHPHMRVIRWDVTPPSLYDLFCTSPSFYLSRPRTPPWTLSLTCWNEVVVSKIEGP